MKLLFKFSRLALWLGFAGTVLTIYGCGDLTSSTGDATPVSSTTSGSSKCASYTDSMPSYPDRLKKYTTDPQCQAQIQNAEGLRLSAIANCEAGDSTAANTIYNSYYPSALKIVIQACP